MTTHGPAPEGLECLVTFEDITDAEQNLCEYRSRPSGTWQAARMTSEVVEMMRTSQFDQYLERVKKTSCAAEMRRLMETGPPEFVSDKHGLALPEGDTHIDLLWYASEGEERSARLENAPEGDERLALWESLREFQSENDADDDAAAGDAGEAGAEG